MENHGWAPNFSQAADFCRHSLYVAGAGEAVSEFWRLDVENYASRVSDTEFTAGMVFFDDWGSLRYAAGAAFSASLYYEVTGDVAARDLAIGQLNYIMGDNPYGRSFVVGFGNNPPVQPHHRNAQGTNDIEQLPFVHTLSGAIVGGPSNTGVGVTAPGYADDVNDYVSNEVALDYNAGLVGLAAFGALEQAAAATP
jgi:endoglucanase